MKQYLSSLTRLIVGSIILSTLVFPPQHSVFAAPILTVTPITWNVIGLDSNNVNAGPNNYPIGVRVCNTGDTTATNVTATFVWDSANANINLRSGSLNPITLSSLANGACSDFYFEVAITRTAAAYDTSRQYHINVIATGLGTISTPIPREVYVEHLVSQNRNSVLDVQVDGVSVTAGGSMNLLVGNTYTITLLSDTATNGYEQIETFINFPNTIFQILSVGTTYSATGGTDSNAASKLYANGCGWIDDPTSPNYRSCTGVGKYGGTITTTYVVKIIGGGGTSTPLSTLIYDFSGSSYHYNSDFALSTRVANISDPSSCTQQTIAQWTFNNTTAPSTGIGSLTTAGIIGPTYVTASGNGTNPAIAYTGWDNAGSANEYMQFAVSTVGYYAIEFSFGGERAGTQAPTTGAILYSSNGSTFTTTASTVTLPNNGTWTNFTPFDFSSINALNNNVSSAFRIYASGGGGGTQANRAAWFDNVTVSGCALPASINLQKTGTIDPTIVPPNNETNIGDHVNYTIVITNDGGVPLTDITLDDSKAASLTCIPALAGLTLMPGQIVTCTGFYVPTQADFDAGSVTNTATADSAQIGPVSDSTTQTLTQSPAFALAKAASPTTYITLGQTITYTYTLTNTGNVTLTAPYSVTDDRVASVDCSAAASPLSPGQSTTCTATYTITPADISAGSITNLATASATFGSTQVNSSQASATITYIAPTNTPTSTPTNPPTFTPTATPTNTLTNTPTNTPTTTNTPTDTPTSTPTDTPTSIPTNTPTNAPTDTPTNTPTDTPTNAPTFTPTNTPTFTPTNTPTSTMTSVPTFTSTSTSIPTQTNTPTNTPTNIPTTTPVPSSDLNLNKSVNSSNPNIGANVTFTLVVTNIGPDNATGVEVTDQLPSGFTFVSANPSQGSYSIATGIWTVGNLTVNATATLTITASVNTTGSYTNTAEITASDLVDPDSIPNNQNPNEDDRDTTPLTPRSGGGGSNNTPTPVPAAPAVASSFLIPVTGFKPGITTDLSHVPYAVYSDTDITIEIPALSLNIPIVGIPKTDGNWNVAWLGNQAGWLEGSAFPSWNGNSVLTGHVYLSNGKPGPFAKLHELAFGDQIIVHAFGQKYIFEVRTNAIIAPNDKSVMKHEEKPWVTLVTCTDYNQKTGTYKNRYIVRAVLMKVTVDK